MKKVLALILLFLNVAFLKSQNEFQKTYGGSGNEFIFSSKQTTDGGFVFAGYSDSYSVGQNDVYVVKTDSIGNVLFSKSYGGTNDDEGYSIIETTDGGYVIAGYTKSFGAGRYDAFIIKINSVGDTLFAKTYGGIKNDFANVIIQTIDGGYLLAGYTTSFVTAADSGNAYLVKTDETGAVIWTKSFGGLSEYTDAYSVQQTNDKGYVITGYTNAFGELNGDAFFTKTDSAGNILFTKTYGRSGVDWGNSIALTNDGNYIIAGTYTADSTTGNDVDVYVLKVNTIGDTIFTKIFGGSRYDYGQDIQQTKDSSFIIGGYTKSFGAGNYDSYFIKINKYGDTLFTKTFGGLGDDETNTLLQAKNGACVLAGISNSFSPTNDYDLYVIKTGVNNSCNQQNTNTTIKYPKTVITNQTMYLIDSITNTNSARFIINDGGNSNDVCNPNSIVESAENSEEIKIFPNPSNGVFTISCDRFNIKKIEIRNLLGELIYSENEINTIFNKEINLNSIVVGAYILRLIYSNKNYESKILINK